MKQRAESEANRQPLLTGPRSSSGASMLAGEEAKLSVSLSGLWSFVHMSRCSCSSTVQLILWPISPQDVPQIYKTMPFTVYY